MKAKERRTYTLQRRPAHAYLPCQQHLRLIPPGTALTGRAFSDTNCCLRFELRMSRSVSDVVCLLVEVCVSPCHSTVLCFLGVVSLPRVSKLQGRFGTPGLTGLAERYLNGQRCQNEIRGWLYQRIVLASLVMHWPFLSGKYVRFSS